jgi:NAD(P)-dependent dehydrogenase (short-subunit alcohol dehydrogenase family)
VVDIDGDAVTSVAREVADEHGVQTLGARMDVGDPTSVRDVVAQVEQVLPPLVGLANIAGVSSPTEFLDVTVEGWDRVLDINLRGTFLVTQAVVRGMIERRLGRVVNVSSISAQRGGGTYSKAPYSAAKAGIIGLSRALAREVSPYGVTVNSVAPGPIDTDIMGGPLTQERKDAMSADVLVGRVGSTGEVAALMAFLLGEDAGYITAATYDINGGLQVS